ncbi:uncharacterized protein N7529_011235 [Penicillium soppii]|uniref:uncharacterized protein n=1 Tax=Penicillium soppii TaxID=69789 RepID=UPI0025478DF2|nr:uncharacterized protein N7529_011235 [Penicillium soppii]KAJ5851850.1 hypothetical protein N7529_011235 [Penicillium soppii]
MYWIEERGLDLPLQFRRDITLVLNQLKKLVKSMAIEYDLNKTAKEQPLFSINEVFVITYCLVAAYDIAFPTARVLFQLNTLRKMIVLTSARPRILILSSYYEKEHDALKWKDINLPIFTYTERDDNLGLYII